MGSNRQKIYIMMAVAVFGNLIFGFVMVAFLINQVNESNTKYSKAREDQGNMIWREKQASLLRKTVSQNQEAIDEIRGTYLDPENDIVFIRLIEGMVERTSTSHELTPLYYTDSEDGNPIMVSAISLIGSYNNTLQFVELFENMNFNSEITGISMSKTGKIITLNNNFEESEVRTTLNFFVYTL